MVQNMGRVVIFFFVYYCYRDKGGVKMLELNEVISEERIIGAIDLLSTMREKGQITMNQYNTLVKPIEMALNYYIEKDNEYYLKYGDQ